MRVKPEMLLNLSRNPKAWNYEDRGHAMKVQKGSGVFFTFPVKKGHLLAQEKVGQGLHRGQLVILSAGEEALQKEAHRERVLFWGPFLASLDFWWWLAISTLVSRSVLRVINRLRGHQTIKLRTRDIPTQLANVEVEKSEKHSTKIPFSHLSILINHKV